MYIVASRRDVLFEFSTGKALKEEEEELVSTLPTWSSYAKTRSGRGGNGVIGGFRCRARGIDGAASRYLLNHCLRVDAT